MRFELIDQVIEQDADRIVAVKNVTSAEEYLADHFPGFPVLPGVMMLETLVQAARLLLAERAAQACGPGEPLVMAQVRNLRYGNMVRPGETLTVEVTLRSSDQEAPGNAPGTTPGWELAGVGRVRDDVAVQGRFRLEPLSSHTAAARTAAGR